MKGIIIIMLGVLVTVLLISFSGNSKTGLANAQTTTKPYNIFAESCQQLAYFTNANITLAQNGITVYQEIIGTGFANDNLQVMELKHCNVSNYT